MKNVKKVKSQPKKTILRYPQSAFACGPALRIRQQLKKHICIMFLVDFRHEIPEKSLKLTKKVEHGPKKVFQPAIGCAQHPKAG